MEEQFESHEGQMELSQKSGGKGRLIAMALCLALLAGAVGGAAGYCMAARPIESAPEALTMSAPEQPVKAEALASGGLDLAPQHDQKLTPADVYEQNVNAVAAINTEGTTTNVWGQASRFAASGSGFLITADGYVITNHHVIDKANRITVTLTSGETYDAELVGADEQNDVALLKIDGKNLPTVSIGDSSKLQVGDMVAAIGNPLGELTNTLTVGYVSALDREINTDGTPINMLQTDAAINSGNSGGPLFDMYGNVIGITSAKYASSSIEGLNFAIPINDAMMIVYDLYEYGYVTARPWLSVYIRDLDALTASYYSLPVGVYVAELVPDGAAEKAGVEAGDIIIGMDDRKVTCFNDLSAALRRHRAGDSVELKIYRGGAEQTLTIVLDEKPRDEEPQDEELQDEEEKLPPITGDMH